MNLLQELVSERNNSLNDSRGISKLKFTFKKYRFKSYKIAD